MLFNKKTKKPQTPLDCLHCPFRNKQTKQCEGIGKNCFLYDHRNKTIIDPITNLPVKIKEK